jgi:hypothetical protein
VIDEVSDVIVGIKDGIETIGGSEFESNRDNIREFRGLWLGS